MSASSTRTLLVAILVATITVKMYAAVVPKIDMQVAISRTLREYGFGPAPMDTAHIRMSFSNTGCRLPLKVEPIRLYLGEGTTDRGLARPGYVESFVYLDGTWTSPDRFAMRRQWLKYRILALFGHSPFVLVPVALQIETPTECPAADAIDWSRIWRQEPKNNSRPAVEAREVSPEIGG